MPVFSVVICTYNARIASAERLAAFSIRPFGGEEVRHGQVLAQVGLLTRENNGLIRLIGSLLPELADLLVENTDT